MWKVTFTEKSGQRSARVFPSRALAESYARTVKAPAIEETGGEATPVTVKVCPVGTEDAQRASSKAFYKQTMAGERYSPNGSSDASESEAERMAEHFGAGRAAGQYIGDTYKDWES